MKPTFPDIARIGYEGPQSKNPLAFKHYNADEIITGKSMRDHLSFTDRPKEHPKMSTKAEKILKRGEVERKSPKIARASRGQELKWEIPVYKTMKPKFGAALAITALLFMSARAFADFTWHGGTDSNFDNAVNWDAPPLAGSNNSGAIIIDNNAGKPLAYTDKQGSTTFTGQFTIGANNGSGNTGELDMRGGTLTIVDSQWNAIIGQATSGTLTMTGGTLNLTGGRATYVGNEANGTINLSGGTISMDGDLYVSRNSTIYGQNFGATINISGGKLMVAGQTSLDVDGGGGAGGTTLKKIEFGTGDGTFVQTTSGKILFPVAGDVDSAYVNFVKGTKGVLSLHGATKDYFEELVKEHRIRIDGQAATPSQFAFTSADSQGLYSLAP